MWRVGIDEAGYGPNLGPMVMACAACHVPGDAPADLWAVLGRAVRKKCRGKDPRLLIDDSKKVHDGKDACAKLERGVLAMLSLAGTLPQLLSELLDNRSAADSIVELLAEPWYRPATPLPVFDTVENVTAAGTALGEACQEANVAWAPPRVMVVPAPRFNAMLDVHKLKSEVEIVGIKHLFAALLALPGDDPVHVAVDRLGGRLNYGPLLQEVFADGWVRVIKESAEACDYAVYGLGRELHFHFQPRADGDFLCVALASMLAKYLREAFMAQFNKYWADLVPGVKPTAGYPLDALRFLNDIHPTLAARGIAMESVWRRK